jgi:gluconate 5-dehydrogenase
MGPPELDLSGRVALVTGASRSIGRATARVLAEAGADVVLGARDTERLEAAAAEVRDAGARAVPVACDVTDAAAVDALVDSAIRDLGRLDIAVANAGVFQEWGPTAELDAAAWERIVATDLTGTMFTCRAAASAMTAGGSIVAVASVAGLVGLPGAAAYTAAKAGVGGLVKSLAAEWAQAGIRVNAVAPGFVVRDDDPLAARPERLAEIEGRTPLGRRGTPREAALAILFLASPAASFVTGATLAVDGGYTSV